MGPGGTRQAFSKWKICNRPVRPPPSWKHMLYPFRVVPHLMVLSCVLVVQESIASNQTIDATGQSMAEAAKVSWLWRSFHVEMDGWRCVEPFAGLGHVTDKATDKPARVTSSDRMRFHDRLRPLLFPSQPEASLL
jgi:hypothetical protein